MRQRVATKVLVHWTKFRSEVCSGTLLLPHAPSHRRGNGVCPVACPSIGVRVRTVLCGTAQHSGGAGVDIFPGHLTDLPSIAALGRGRPDALHYNQARRAGPARSIAAATAPVCESARIRPAAPTRAGAKGGIRPIAPRWHVWPGRGLGRVIRTYPPACSGQGCPAGAPSLECGQAPAPATGKQSDTEALCQPPPPPAPTHTMIHQHHPNPHSGLLQCSGPLSDAILPETILSVSQGPNSASKSLRMKVVFGGQGWRASQYPALFSDGTLLNRRLLSLLSLS